MLMITHGDDFRRGMEPHLIETGGPHHGKAGSHQCASSNFYPGKWMEKLDEIPGADIQYDGQEGHGNDRAFEPDRTDIGMAEGIANNEENESQAE